jgi:protein-disulfide isomerase
MPLLGLGYYLAALAVAALGIRAGQPPGRAALLAGLSVLGVAVMAALTTIELTVIHALCSWCLLSALASVMLAGGAVVTWRGAALLQATLANLSARRARRTREVSESADRVVRRFTLLSSIVAAAAFAALLMAPVLASQPATRADGPAAMRPTRGSGPVQVMVFSDFQCPACAVAAPALTEVVASGRVTLVYRFFPLMTIHANARAAALAALAADGQHKFWEFHDALFARQAEWADLAPARADQFFEHIATELGLDLDAWRASVGSVEASATLDSDLQAARELNLRGTPTIFINGVEFRGSLDASSLMAVIRR